MIHTIAESIIHFTIKNSPNSEKDKLHWEICLYGVEVFLSTVLNCIIVLLCGLAWGMVGESLLFLLAFIPLRIYSGGYHADTYFKCNTIFAILVFFCFTLFRLSDFVKNSIAFAICIVIIQALLCLLYAPIEHENKKLTQKQKKMYKRRALTALAILSVLLLFSTKKNLQSLKVIVCAVLLNIIFMTISLTRRKMYEVIKKKSI